MKSRKPPTKRKEQTIMKLGNLAEVYYSAAEARKRLGIDENTFQYWGKNGRITRVYLPGRKQAVYSKKEINNMAHVIEATAIAEKGGGYQYRKATINDLEEEFRLARVIFGRAADTPEMRQGKRAFLAKNPDIDYHLYDKGNFVACLHIVPMKHQAIVDFLDNKVRAWLIHPDNVEQFEPGKPLECLLLDTLTTPAVEPIKRGTYASRLLANFGDTLEEWGRQGIEFSKFYGASATPSGIRILKSADFKELEVQEDSGRITFELDVTNSDAKWLRFYKEAFEQWRQQQELSSNHSTPKRRKVQTTK
jgi:hypothetical protein